MLATLNGTQLFYTVEGGGKAGYPILFLHGTGFDHTYFRPWLDPLSTKNPLVFFDSRGCGRSSRTDALGGSTIETLADDIDALRAHLGLDQIILHGHSFGGFPALVYARKHSDRLAGLVLDCTIPGLDYQPVMINNLTSRATAEQVQLVVEGFNWQIPGDDALRSLMEQVLPIYFHRYDEEIGAGIIANTQFSAAALNHFGALITSINLLDRLPEIKIPTLALAGRHDWICPPREGAERLHACIENSQLAIFEQSGHFPFIEEQDIYLSTVRDWLETLT